MAYLQGLNGVVGLFCARNLARLSIQRPRPIEGGWPGSGGITRLFHKPASATIRLIRVP